MPKEFFHKIIAYNYLYEFSFVEKKIKDKFKQFLLETDSEQIKTNFLLLHLSEEIKTSFIEGISNNAFQIKKKYYKMDISDVKLKWNLKKQLEFAKNNDFLVNILPTDLNHFVKKEKLLTFSFMKASIKLRNAIAHEAIDIKVKGNLELLSDEKLNELINEDDEFDNLYDVAKIEIIYKQILTHYFYLKQVNKLIRND